MGVKKPIIGIVSGSTSDFPSLEDAMNALDELQIPYSLDVKSAHRLPNDMEIYAKDAGKKGLKVIIAAAGGAVDLTGMIAAHTIIPVIGLPIKSNDLNGMDSLLSMVQMPNGTPVGVMGIGRGKNAALYAAQILAISDKGLGERLMKFRERMGDSTRTNARKEILKKAKSHPYLSV